MINTNQDWRTRHEGRKTLYALCLQSTQDEILKNTLKIKTYETINGFKQNGVIAYSGK
jgi:hypothetical protein